MKTSLYACKSLYITFFPARRQVIIFTHTTTTIQVIPPHDKHSAGYYHRRPLSLPLTQISLAHDIDDVYRHIDARLIIEIFFRCLAGARWAWRMACSSLPGKREYFLD